MAKTVMMQKLDPKQKGKVQKRKVKKSKPTMTLIATSEMLAEREYTDEQTTDVLPLVEGIDRNMIKEEEIKLEAEAMECDEVVQCSTNSVRITTEELVKIEPESFLGTEAFSNPVQAKTTVSKSVRKKRKNVANERQKLAEKQEKRQEKRAKNPDRHKENIAQLPDYRELSQTHNQV
ncbi:hypothetical protein Ddc_19563 [Ditylenchus destructor]|nr:hypothetical protein Ddc_19563 [Ditylenchus destructor]